MKKALFVFFLFLPLLFLTGCLTKKQKASLQIFSTPTASVFINGKLVGKTPYSGSEIEPGEISLKLIPETTTVSLVSWEGKIKLAGGVKGVIVREFAETDEASSGDILTLEKTSDKKNSSLAVVTYPDGATVKIDGENRGFSPLVLEKIDEGERQISLTLSGYKERIIKAKSVNGYKLIVNSKIAKESGGENLPELSGSPTPTDGKTKTSPTPKPSLTVTPKISVTPRPTLAIKGASVEIKDTPTGWLRVRESPSTTAVELTKIYPGEKYPLLEEKTDWFKITYVEGKEGWISSQYAQKITSE